MAIQLPQSLIYDQYRTWLMFLGHSRHHGGPPRNTPRRANTLGDRNDHRTDWCIDQTWSIDNLPEILYLMDRPTNWLSETDLETPPRMSYMIYGQFLRNIPILPDHIGASVEGWRIEFWSRMDPRVRFHDLAERMSPNSRPTRNPDATYRGATVYQMRRNRFREGFQTPAWVTRGLHHQRDTETIQALQSGLLNPTPGSTRGLSWGLTDPNNSNSTRIPGPSSGVERTCSVEAAPTQGPLLQSAVTQYMNLLTTITPAPVVAVTIPAQPVATALTSNVVSASSPSQPIQGSANSQTGGDGVSHLGVGIAPGDINNAGLASTARAALALNVTLRNRTDLLGAATIQPNNVLSLTASNVPRPSITSPTLRDSIVDLVTDISNTAATTFPTSATADLPHPQTSLQNLDSDKGDPQPKQPSSLLAPALSLPVSLARILTRLDTLQVPPSTDQLEGSTMNHPRPSTPGSASVDPKDTRLANGGDEMSKEDENEHNNLGKAQPLQRVGTGKPTMHRQYFKRSTGMMVVRDVKIAGDDRPTTIDAPTGSYLHPQAFTTPGVDLTREEIAEETPLRAAPDPNNARLDHHNIDPGLLPEAIYYDETPSGVNRVLAEPTRGTRWNDEEDEKTYEAVMDEVTQSRQFRERHGRKQFMPQDNPDSEYPDPEDCEINPTIRRR